jgi:hypothetical protein
LRKFGFFRNPGIPVVDDGFKRKLAAVLGLFFWGFYDIGRFDSITM